MPAAIGAIPVASRNARRSPMGAPVSSFARHGLRRRLKRALDFYRREQVDECLDSLRALIEDVTPAMTRADRRVLGEALEVRARVELDRGATEACLQSLATAADELSRDPENRDMLGRVQYQIASLLMDLPGYESETSRYFVEARGNLDRVGKYAQLVDTIDSVFDENAQADWRERRSALETRLEELANRLEELPVRSRGRRAEERARSRWLFTKVLHRYGSLLIEHGDDSEFEIGPRQ